MDLKEEKSLPTGFELDVYLDNSSTSQPLPEVLKAMTACWGNPSSAHGKGEIARRQLRRARDLVAEITGSIPSDVIFTSGATEANNIVLQSLLRGDKSEKRLVTSNVEHSSIVAAAEHLACEGVEVVTLKVDSNGQVDPQVLGEAIKPEHTLVSIQWANNETGVVQDIGTLAEITHMRGGRFHTDAVQAVGKVSVRLDEYPIDFLSLSGHKVHGPSGVGAIVGPGVSTLKPIVFGGDQEMGIRPGTESLPNVVGLGKALELRLDRFGGVQEKTTTLRDNFEEFLILTDVVEQINGKDSVRLPNLSNLQFKNIDGEALVLQLSNRGVYCSQTSACTNHRPEPSYVLRAMGLTEQEAYASVRFCFSELNTQEDVENATSAIRDVLFQLSRSSDFLRKSLA